MMLGERHRKRRLLFLLPFAPRLDAAHGGSRVTAQLLVNLTARHDVALLYLRAADEAPADDILQKQCELVEEVIRPETGFSFAHRWSRMTSLLCGKPFWAIAMGVVAYETHVRKIAQAWQPDIVQAEFHVMGQYFSALHDCTAPRVLTLHEPGTKAARDLWWSRKGFERVIYSFELLAWQRFEQRIIREAQAVVVFTEKDRRAIVRFAQQTPIIQIPFGAVLPERPLNPLGYPPLSLVFVGGFKHLPNVDAAIRLIDKIFPRVEACIPSVVLYIVGDRPPLQIQQVGNENIIVTGRVEDVNPYLDRASLVVVPLRLGGGMRVKVLEALAAGKAVVASSLAIEGLDLVDGEQVAVAENDEQFCKAIVELLADPERRALLAARARAWACANLGWDKSIAAYEELYERLLQH